MPPSPPPEEKKKGEHQLYSAKALAGFCLMANNGWNERANTGWVSGAATRQLVLNSNGTCSGCARLPKLAGYVGVIEQAELRLVLRYRISKGIVEGRVLERA
mgnify:CR=1 FL=1